MTTTQVALDFDAIKSRQKMLWASGDYAVVGTTLTLTGELLCEAMDLRPGQRVLDVAAGNGNATLAAARRWCDVTSSDYVPALLEQGRTRAEADRFQVTFREADAENLPFADSSFDAVISTFGVMFAPNQEQAAHEMLRVCRSGDKIGLAVWTPDSFIGQVLRTIGKYVPPPAGLRPPSSWGVEANLKALFGDGISQLQITARNFNFRYHSPEHWIEVFRDYYGPIHKAFATLDQTGQTRLYQDLLALLQRFNTAGHESLVVPSEYLEVVATRR